MAFNFSANQFERGYSAKRLGNWQLPKWHPPRPRQRQGATKVIANERGHLLDNVPRTDKNPWGYFRSTYELPNKITRCFADEYNKCLLAKHKWKHFPRKQSVCENTDKEFERPKCKSKCRTVRGVFNAAARNEKPSNACATAAENARKLKFHSNTKKALAFNHPDPIPSTELNNDPADDIFRHMCSGTELTSNATLKTWSESDFITNENHLDLEYVPGDFTPAQQQHPTRDLLLQQKYERDHNIEPELPLDKLYLGDHLCKYDKSAAQVDDFKRDLPPPPLVTSPLPRVAPIERSLSPSAPLPPPTETTLLPQTAAFVNDSVTPTLDYFKKKFPLNEDQSATLNLSQPNMPLHTITDKPNARCPSPVIPAYANFELAKRMHHDNLDHQPLPDCVADLAFRKRQLIGSHPGLALDIDPIATGVGVKMHNAGPTHCTKMRVFRPRTCGVTPKAYNGDLTRAISAAQHTTKPMTAMDLAIRWDYRPTNPADEPQPPPHIDGSDETGGPAVFNYVKTPRDGSANDLGRSAGVFNSTLGERDFFDKDIMRRKTDFTGQHIARESDCGCGTSDCGNGRARSVTRSSALPGNRLNKQYRSSPNVMADDEYRGLRAKYLGEKSCSAPVCDALVAERGCRRAKGFGGASGFLRRARSRLCHKVAPEPPSRGCCEMREPCRMAPPFRTGIPKYNAAGHFVSADSGCSLDSHHGGRVVVVPRPRDPYAKRNYDIDTLVPPFRSYGGGAGEGGYPEHWRLSSVYQHAYKPLEQRRRPLLQTVYK